jgi:capsular polysaccharide biosynthesis protein
LRSNENRIRSELFGYERNLVTAPNVETEYVQLTRQYEASQKQFTDLQQKIKSASFAENVESEAKGEKFAIIREVSVPTTPYSPNRTGILLISLLLGLGLGFLLAVIADAADPTVRSANDIEGVFGKDPIAVIPVLYTAADLQQRRRAIGSAAAIYAAATLVVVAIISVFGH